MGVGQVGAGGGLDRRAGRRGCGVSPGHRAESRGVLARENQGRRWRGPGGGGGRGPSPPGWDGEGAGALGGVSSGSPCRSPRPLSSAATQVGARPTWGSGRRAISARRDRGAQPPLPCSPPRGPARLLPTRGPGSGGLGCSRGGAPPAARSLARPWRPGSPALPRGEPAGAGRRGEPGRGGRAGRGLRRGREGGSGRASERAGRLCAAPVRLGARWAAAGHTDRGQTAPGSRAAAARLAALVAHSGPRGPRRVWAGGPGEGNRRGL